MSVCFYVFCFFGAKIWPAAADTGELGWDLRDPTPPRTQRDRIALTVASNTSTDVRLSSSQSRAPRTVESSDCLSC
jgi:hypothetical protein